MPRFTLTHKTLIFVVITLAVIISLRIGSARLIILKEFTNLEEDLSRQNMERLLAAIDQHSQWLVRTVGDWGAWTDTLRFIQGEAPDYVSVNLSADTFINLDLDLILLADSAKKIHFAKNYSTEQEALGPIDPGMIQFLTESLPLWVHPDSGSCKVGLLQSPMGLLMLADGPIVDSDRAGPVSGTIIMARRFGPQALAILESDLQMEIATAIVEPDRTASAESRHTSAYLTHSPIDVQPLNSERLEVSTRLDDRTGQATIRLAAVLPRQITAQGHRTIHYFLTWQAISGIVVVILAIAFIRRIILNPIARLNHQVTAIAASSSFTDRLEVASTDEVGEASRAINLMLEALEAANTRLKAAFDEVKVTQSQLVQSAKLAAIGELAAGVAHELNQPLMVIRGTAQMVQRGLKRNDLSPEALSEQLVLVERNTKRMMNIIEHLEAFSRQPLEETGSVDINRTIENCLLLIGQQLRVQGIDISLDLAKDLPEVRCVQNQIEQVLINLITNARDAILEKHNTAGSDWWGRICVKTARATGSDAAVEIQIKDNAGGITKEQQEWIFDPFFSTKAVGQGTGLGLSISYGIIQKHNGDLRVLTTGPEGTAFVVRLLADPETQGTRSTPTEI